MGGVYSSPPPVPVGSKNPRQGHLLLTGTFTFALHAGRRRLSSLVDGHSGRRHKLVTISVLGTGRQLFRVIIGYRCGLWYSGLISFRTNP